MLNITITSIQVTKLFKKLNLPQGYKSVQTTVCLFPYWDHCVLFSILLLDIGPMTQFRTVCKPETLNLACRRTPTGHRVFSICSSTPFMMEATYFSIALSKVLHHSTIPGLSNQGHWTQGRVKWGMNAQRAQLFDQFILRTATVGMFIIVRLTPDQQHSSLGFTIIHGGGIIENLHTCDIVNCFLQAHLLFLPVATHMLLHWCKLRQLLLRSECQVKLSLQK